MRDILFTIPLPWKGGGLPVHSYGVMAMLGFLAALFAARRRAKQVGISPDNVTDFCIAALIGGIVGARLFYCIQFPRQFNSLWDYFAIWRGGLVFYGGLFGAMLALAALIRIKKERLLNVLDLIALSLCLGLGIARIGCFLHGCCYGIPVDANAWYGVVFPDNAPPYSGGGVRPIPAGTPLFPSQLLSALNLLLIFIILSLYFKHRRRAGEITGLTLILYSVHRFGVEFLRSDTHLPGRLSIAQWISLPLFFGGLMLFIFARTSGRPEPVPSPSQSEKGGHPTGGKSRKGRKKKKKRA